ncbi:MAG: class I SAM-dependent methyltransferase [Verrucomicrobiota bacterium]|nr:class I SAM-dependent methyltransferase [Verrucomicrobiota bacterium]
MNWKHLKGVEWLDRRAWFLSGTPKGGRHLEAGCSTCLTLRHFMELRPDLEFSALDYHDFSPNAPVGVEFHQLDLIEADLPFANESFDSITLMHVMEHLPRFGKVPFEFYRILKPGGRLYVEGPSPRSLLFPSSPRITTLNFWDDPTHIAPLSYGRINRVFGLEGMRVLVRGHNRSWPLILAMPWTFLKRDWHHFLAGFIHLFGWNIYVVFQKKAE